MASLEYSGAIFIIDRQEEEEEEEERVLSHKIRNGLSIDPVIINYPTVILLQSVKSKNTYEIKLFQD
jgi:hypothetical protein